MAKRFDSTPPDAAADLDVSAELHGTYLKAADVRDGPLTFQISHVERVQFEARGDEPQRAKIVVTLEGEPVRKLALNKTNLQVFCDAWGKSAAGWIGQVFDAFFDPDVRDLRGARTGGLRVRLRPSRRPTRAAVDEDDGRVPSDGYDEWKTEEPAARPSGSNLRYRCRDCSWSGQGGVQAYLHHAQALNHRIVLAAAPAWGPVFWTDVDGGPEGGRDAAVLQAMPHTVDRGLSGPVDEVSVHELRRHLDDERTGRDAEMEPTADAADAARSGRIVRRPGREAKD